jgi:Vacuolar protein sorting 55
MLALLHQAMSHPLPVFSAGGLAFSFSLGVLLQLLGCLLWHNWWPMLTAFMYVLVPMPMLFFGGMDSGSYGGSTLASG